MVVNSSNQSLQQLSWICFFSLNSKSFFKRFAYKRALKLRHCTRMLLFIGKNINKTKIFWSIQRVNYPMLLKRFLCLVCQQLLDVVGATVAIPRSKHTPLEQIWPPEQAPAVHAETFATFFHYFLILVAVLSFKILLDY